MSRLEILIIHFPVTQEEKREKRWYCYIYFPIYLL